MDELNTTSRGDRWIVDFLEVDHEILEQIRISIISILSNKNEPMANSDITAVLGFDTPFDNDSKRMRGNGNITWDVLMRNPDYFVQDDVTRKWSLRVVS